MLSASAGVAESEVDVVAAGGRKAGFPHLKHSERSTEPTKALLWPACSWNINDRQSLFRMVLHPSMSDI